MKTQKSDFVLSTGRTVSHRPYLSNGEPNGATEAFIVEGGEMTDAEWAEYCQQLHRRNTLAAMGAA